MLIKINRFNLLLIVINTYFEPILCIKNEFSTPKKPLFYSVYAGFTAFFFINNLLLIKNKN